MDILIRPMLASDYETVRQLWESTPGVGLDESDERSGIELYLQRNTQLSLVAVSKERMIAAVLCGHDGRRGYISHLAVHHDYRQRGIGRQLVKECLDRLSRQGLIKCNLRIYSDNANGVAFWRSLGWTLRDDVLVMTTYAQDVDEPRDPRSSFQAVADRVAAPPVGIPWYQIDAFADGPFRGNPAAVCLLQEPAEAEWMQLVAAEMNLSETAFVHRTVRHVASNRFSLRWFTPRVEVDLCGHATLAAAHVLYEQRWVDRGVEIEFETRSGVLRTIATDMGLQLDFPATRVEALQPPEGLIEALGCQPTFVGKSRFDYFVELESADAVRDLAPDFGALKRVETRGVIVTSQSDENGYDFISRFFAPACGVDEDPVTGSAHCCLAPYWHEKLGRAQMTGRQASPRGGDG